MRRHRFLLASIIFFALALLCASALNATTYYINKLADAGGDGTTQTLTGVHCPFQTITAGLAAVTGDQHGNSLLVARGTPAPVYREQATIGAYGTAAGQFTFGAYGTGADPIIDGSDLVGTWTAYAGGTWTSVLSRTPNNSSVNGWSFNVRTIIAAGLASSGTKIRATLHANSTTQSIYNSISIGVATTAEDFDATPTRITFGGGSSSVTIAAAGTALSDEITFAYNKDIRHLIAIYQAAWCVENVNPSGGMYYISSAGDDSMTSAVSGYTEVSGQAGPISLLEVFNATPNVWQAALTTEPSQVFFNGTRGTKVASIALCNGANKWFWAANVLYCYSTSDPDTAFVAPGIEASIRTRTVYVNGKPYVTLQNLDCRKSKISDEGSVYVNWSNPAIVDSITAIDNDAFAGIYVQGPDDGSLIKNCVVSYTRHTFDGYGFGIMVDGAGENHIIQDCTSSYNTGSGIRAWMWTLSDGVTIQRNTSHHNDWPGIAAVGDGTNGANIVIQNNLVYENCQTRADAFGIDLWKCGANCIARYNIVHDTVYTSTDAGGIRYDADPGGIFGSGGSISDNLIYNERTGIMLLGGDATSIYNNSIYNSAAYGIRIQGGSCDADIVKNNIIHTAGTNLIYNQDATNSVINYNCYYDTSYTNKFNWNGTTYSTIALWRTGSSQDANSIAADPKFTSLVTPDFHLLPASPCINAGVNVGLTLDYEGNTVPKGRAPDIGAYEYPARKAAIFLLLFGIK
jgi:hypothetical protein